MRNLLEKAIVSILNGDQDKAEALFHRFIVEKARQIHEGLRQGEDVELNENWATEIREEDYFDGDDVADEDEGDDFEGEGDADAEMAAEPGTEAPMDGADGEMPDVVGDEGEADMDLAGDEDLEAGNEDLSSKIDDMTAKLDELTAEFDRLMAKMDSDDGLDDEELGDEGGLDDLGDEGMGDEGLDEPAADMEGDEDVTDMGMGGEEPSDIADRLGSDMGDEHQPEHEMAEAEEAEVDEDDEMLEDITESVLSELDRIAAPGNSDGKTVGSGGGSVSTNHGDNLPNHPADQRWQQAKPFMVKAEGDAHNDSFERETPPSSKKINVKARNNDAGVKKLKSVPAKGDASAELNHDFTDRPKTKSIVDGKPSK